MDLWQELEQKIRQLEQSVRQLKHSGTEYAAAGITVIVGGIMMHRMLRDFAAESHSDVSTPLIATRELSDNNL